MRVVGGDGVRAKFLVRDRVAAYMVRAAASGAFNYANADPYDKQWRLRHILMLREMARRTDETAIREIHEHWLAYISHSQLEPDSWADVKKRADEALDALNSTIYPWAATGKSETKTAKDTIYEKYGDLIDSYRAMVAAKKAEIEKAD